MSNSQGHPLNIYLIKNVENIQRVSSLKVFNSSNFLQLFVSQEMRIRKVTFIQKPQLRITQFFREMKHISFMFNQTKLFMGTVVVY